MSAKSPRIIVRIEVTPAAKAIFHDTAKRYGMTQVEVTSRLLEWAATQDEGVQAAILGQYPKALEADVCRLLLARMNDPRTKATTTPAGASGKPKRQA